MRSPLGNALGMGTAREGTGHWWHQRLTALALIPLTFWLVYSLIVLAGLSRAEVLLWMQNPFNAVLLLLFLVSMFYHAYLGLEVIVQDYMHAKWLKVTALIIVQFTMIVLAALSILIVLRMALAGGAS